MLIGVVSDTHRDYYMIQTAMEYLKYSDLIIHLGDNVQDVEIMAENYKGRIISVRGNCDFSVMEPSEKIEMIENKKFLVTHGHTYDVKYSLNSLKFKAKDIGAEVALYGHTHIPMIDFEEGIWYINPGSAAFSRRGDNSIAFINIKEGIIHPNIKTL